VADIRNFTLNFGPQHPAAHGVLRLVLEMDGEVIQKADPHIGLLHRATEKLAESKPFNQSIGYMDRLDYVSMMCNEHAYVRAIEKLLGIQAPERAQYIRTMFDEMTRILNHLMWLGSHGLDIGAMTVFLYCFREREDLLRIFEMFSGQRMMTSYFRVGGLALEPPRGWHQPIRLFLDAFPEHVEEYENLLTNNPIWLRRTKGVGHAPLEDLIDLGVTGPMLRAAGLAWDIRKAEPYSSYEKFDFDVPTRTDGDVYARYQVRLEEMHQSARIARQALDGMPSGPWTADAPGIVLPDREKMKTQMEALIYHFKIVYEGFKVPAGEVYQAIESPRGEQGYYVVSDGSAKPYRVHIHGPSFGNLQATSRMVEGRLLADVIAALGSMDFVLGDVDR